MAAERGVVVEPLWGPDETDQRHPRSSGDLGMTNGAHLLIIEDDEPLAGLLSAHLRAHGYLVTVAPTAEAAGVPPGRAGCART